MDQHKAMPKDVQMHKQIYIKAHFILWAASYKGGPAIHTSPTQTYNDKATSMHLHQKMCCT